MQMRRSGGFRVRFEEFLDRLRGGPGRAGGGYGPGPQDGGYGPGPQGGGYGPGPQDGGYGPGPQDGGYGPEGGYGAPGGSPRSTSSPLRVRFEEFLDRLRGGPGRAGGGYGPGPQGGGYGPGPQDGGYGPEGGYGSPRPSPLGQLGRRLRSALQGRRY
jgi:hypothetical protein